MRSVNRSRLKVAIQHNKLISFLFSPFIKVRRALIHKRNRRKTEKYDEFRKKIVDGTVILQSVNFCGEFEIDSRSDILKRFFFEGEYERENTKKAIKYVSLEKDILDIGANIGLYTVFFAKINPGRRVLAIEPTNHAMELLERNLQRNGIKDSVVLYKGVATDQECEVQITLIPGMEEYSTIGEKMAYQVDAHPKIQSYQVPGNKIDYLVEKYKLTPGFIKIDTEGSEFKVLSGAAQVLKKYRPVLLSELDDKYLTKFGNTSLEVINLLKDYGYQVIDLMTEQEPRIPFSGEILAIPFEYREVK